MALLSLSLLHDFFTHTRNPSFPPTSSKPYSFQNIPSRSLSIRSGVAILPVLSFEGEKIGETYLNLRTARPETARAVVHRAIVTDLRNKRRGTASTKTTAEVRGGGRKPYPQKGTGRARRGSQRTPLRRGGGVVFGPKPKDWTIKMNRKEKKLALGTALWSAAVDSIVLEDFNDRFKRPKTKDFLAAMKNWGVDPRKKSMFFLTEISRNLRLSSRNINTLKLLTPIRFNLFDILNSDKLVYTQASVDYLNKMYPNKTRFKHTRREFVVGEDDRGVIPGDGEEREGVEGGVWNGDEEEDQEEDVFKNEEDERHVLNEGNEDEDQYNQDDDEYDQEKEKYQNEEGGDDDC